VVTYYKNQLSKEAYIGALTELYKAQAALNRIRGLLATATLIESYTAEQPDLQSLLKHRDQVLEVLAQHPYIDTPAEINSDRPWQHGLYYKTFGFTVSSGKLHKIELRCDKKIRRFAITKDQQSWQIPASWGDCDLFTWGTQGTKFNLVEKRQDEPKD
ncbi:MAG: hypothetical protein OIF35_01435, partial [Cellvibrionaceae bacterium]|nr:hypothetical protein [Cellvibrionaceae bacterium]